MLYNNVCSATMRTPHALSCSTLKKTHKYATGSCKSLFTISSGLAPRRREPPFADWY